jgi:hypothetical protein
MPPDASWVSATATRAYCKNDPLLDWLNLYGEASGFARDDHVPGFDSRTDFLTFILRQGQLFEQAVVRYLSETVAPVRIVCRTREDIQDEGKRDETLAAMKAGEKLIGQAALWNPARKTYGAADLLVRSDIFRELWPDLIGEEDARIGAFELGQPHHYRVIDVKFTTLSLIKDGHLSGSQSQYMAQVFTYNEALGHTQGFEPPAAYILGRGWTSGDERGRSCLERLGRVNRDFIFNRNKGPSLEDLVAEAVAWVRRVRSDGAGWQVLPEPSMAQLHPNMNHNEDQPWHAAKKRIADELDELTLLWNVRVTGREEAHRAGITRWTDPQLTASHVGINGVKVAPTLNAILEINRTEHGPIILPDRVRAAEEEWRQPGPSEFYVDFEFVTNLADDFSRIPEEGGQPLIYMIGCGHLENGQWRFFQWTCERLTEACEERIIDAWLAHMAAVSGSAALRAMVIHWAPAEPINYEIEYNSAKARHPDKNWPELRWFDFLNRVIKAEPVVVRGAMAFGLKAVARAMLSHGCIQTEWADGPTDGLGAMVGAWSCDAEASAAGSQLTDLPLMQAIAHYNEVDCKVMQEIVGYLRAKH